MKIFGPVPSRRLGNSLGINNIPYKKCSYSCVYCQVGRTRRYTTVPEECYKAPSIVSDIEKKVGEVHNSGDRIDYLTFVPDGEPTLDKNLSRIIDGVGHLGIPIAVITNATTLMHKPVFDTLLGANWVSVKVDSPIDEVWKAVNRPAETLKIEQILNNILKFKNEFQGTLVTESMLVGGINDGEQCIAALAGYLKELAPDCSYLSAPIRPPAEEGIVPPDEAVVAAAYDTISQYVEQVECLFGHEGNAFHSSGNPREDLLSITAVHPMREEAVNRLLEKSGSGWPVMQELIEQGMMKEVEFNRERFYLRSFKSS